MDFNNKLDSIKIIYGTGNQAKLQQVQSFFEINNVNIEILSLKDIGFDKDIIEDGKTFEENSMIKAKVIKEFCDANRIEAIIVTDDAGLCVDALNGEPGVYSARYAGDHAPQDKVLEKLLLNLKNTPFEKRTAQFICVLTAILPDGEEIVSKGISEGYISEKPGPLGKLTYGPVFIPKGTNKVMNEMTEEEVAKFHSHRQVALTKLVKQLKAKYKF